MTKVMEKRILTAGMALIGVMMSIGLSSCEGRKAENMVPKGETIEVVIPTGDVAEDSAIAAGDVEKIQ